MINSRNSVGIAGLIVLALSVGCTHARGGASAKVEKSTRKETPEPQTQALLTPHPIEYSNMKIDRETGDFLGTDLRITSTGDGYDVAIFLGEGVPEGPCHAHLQSLLGKQSVMWQPANQLCAGPATLDFSEKGLYIQAGQGEPEFVPRHKNFIKQERFK